MTKEKNWQNNYPLNTFNGETKKELEKFISSLLKAQREEIVEIVKKIDVDGGGSGRRLKVQILKTIKNI